MWLVISTSLLKVKITGGHIHCKSGSILKMVQEREVVKTGN